MEETVRTIHIWMVRRNILCVKKRQDGNLSHSHCSKMGPMRRSCFDCGNEPDDCVARVTEVRMRAQETARARAG
ncbi:hypothetical protein DR63_1863 [Burkholderia thailandensis E264]|nr:hypothetical protein BTQ_104 [Burkholderia thailandensis 2002721723]AIP24320.1 hypothetical protein DR63_1863 [Burkholderia thailandensis E264]